MLSRIAESLFWIGRYLERAEDTCRILDVHLQILLEDPSVDQDGAALNLLQVMGAPAPVEADPISSAVVLRSLCYDIDSTCSIVTAISGAREAARRARETISIETWEAINTTWNDIKAGQLQNLRSATAFKFVRERCAVISGVVDQTMSHDEGWHFLTLGRSLERADMTARMILTAGAQGAWDSVLRGCGAHHAFVRTYGGATSDRDAAEFLLLDRLFPRSVVYTLNQAERALLELDQHHVARAGFADEALRLLGAARYSLEYGLPQQLLEGLSRRMADLQRTCAQVSEAVTERYFAGALAASWQGGK
ncbi:MAG: alpha-E domain-containing protein [Propionibacteriaceae bacterium]|jgi:uncharacterized alpha-E superfamily protein|nr:alpha-E domain-containing protein [Propionibacteriaceae bacterium]